jgi:hypothetical protein
MGEGEGESVRGGVEGESMGFDESRVLLE